MRYVCERECLTCTASLDTDELTVYAKWRSAILLNHHSDRTWQHIFIGGLKRENRQQSSLKWKYKQTPWLFQMIAPVPCFDTEPFTTLHDSPKHFTTRWSLLTFFICFPCYPYNTLLTIMWNCLNSQASPINIILK